MVNEEFYERVVQQLKKAKDALARAEDIREFAEDADIALPKIDVDIDELKERIRKYEDALIKRGYTLEETIE